jgi:uncharacterized integral membrane protein
MLARHPAISYFETNCTSPPAPSLLAELLALARGGDLQALVCFKQMFCGRRFVVSSQALFLGFLLFLTPFLY